MIRYISVLLASMTVFSVIACVGMQNLAITDTVKEQRRVEELKAYKLKGSEKISDKELKKQFFDYVICEETDDFIKMYKHISKRRKEQYRKSHPNVINAKTFDDVKRSVSEITGIRYVEILSCKKISSEKYQIGIKLEAYSEGDHMWVKDIYYFIKENDQWKYDGFDSERRESAIIAD